MLIEFVVFVFAGANREKAGNSDGKYGAKTSMEDYV